METLDLNAPWFLAVVLGCALAEAGWRILAARKGYDAGGALASAGVAIGQFIATALTAGLVGSASLAVQEASPLKVDMAAWWAWPAAFLAVEFAYYWFHRLSHETRWMWATHAVHHTPNEMTFPAAIRLGWTGFLSGAPLFYLPVIALGFPPAVVYGLLIANLRFQFFLHTECVGRLGVLDLIFNTPSNHRVHHASNPAYLDRNYGGVLMVFDHLFGTYAPERADTPPRYGLTTPLHSRNPVVIALHQWPALLRGVWRAPGVRGRLRFTFGYPGERP